MEKCKNKSSGGTDKLQQKGEKKKNSPEQVSACSIQMTCLPIYIIEIEESIKSIFFF